MSSYQFAIDNAESIQLGYQDIINDTVSRNGNIRTGRIAGTRPFQFEVLIKGYFDAANVECRAFLQHLDQNAVVTTETIDIGATNTGLNYITGYQGNCSTAYLESLNFYPTPGILDNSAQGSTVTPSYYVLTLQEANITHRPASASTVIFEQGDFIQFNYTGTTGPDTNQQVPYQVMETVTFGDKYAAGNGFYDVKVNRHYYGKFGSGAGGISTPHLKVGSNVSFNVALVSKPKYEFITGGKNGFITFNDSFKFVEVI